MTVLPTIRHQLLQAAERNAAAGAPVLSGPRSKWRVPRRLGLATSRLATAALIVVTVVVAVGAIILLGHGRHSQAVGSGQVATRQQLLQTLGLLRTSPTATDRAATACIERTTNKFGDFKCYRDIPDYGGTVIWEAEHPAPVALSAIASMGNPRWDLTLIRNLNLGSGASIMIFPGDWRRYTYIHGFISSPPSTKRVWGIVAVFLAHRDDVGQSLPTSVATLRAQGLVVLAPSSKTLRVAIIVPDGVARVTVGTISLGRQHWLENLTAAVHDNIATLKLRTPNSRYNGLQSADAQVTWYGAHGRIIKRTTTPMEWEGL